VKARWLPWRRRAEAQEKALREGRLRLHRIHQDWAKLADPLTRIDREIEINDWTRTARRVFSGGEAP
jgi:hypothetical protein